MHSKEKSPKYPERIDASTVGSVEFALADGSQATVDVYVALPEQDTDANPTIVIPGFTEGIVQDAKFADSLCEITQSSVIVVGQYERDVKKFMSSKHALENQALAVLGFIEKLELQNSPVNIFANSLGAAVFARAAELAQEREWTCFTDAGSRTIFMAPAGLKKDDTRLKVGKRFIGAAVGDTSLKNTWDTDSLLAGQKEPGKDFKKWASEMFMSSGVKIDFKKLKHLGIMPDIITSPSDGVMGPKDLGESIISLMDPDAETLDTSYIRSWSSPFAPELVGLNNEAELAELGYSKKEIKDILANSNEKARHNSHMVNGFQAERTARAVAAILRN